MFNRRFSVTAVLCCVSMFLVSLGGGAESSGSKSAGVRGTKVYVPYDKLKDVFEKEAQGVFLSYKEFQKLWRAAQSKPAAVSEAPFDYLISTARFQGKVQGELAALRLKLTVDILVDDWVEVPLGLGEVAVSEVTFLEPKKPPTAPLLRMVDGQYCLMTKGRGRYVLALDFVRQMETRPGLHILQYRLPSAAITTLELLIPEENLKVDVKPMLAATTSQVEVDDATVTRLQAFLGAAKQVELSWKPRTEAAAELEPVVVESQFQHIIVEEALLHHHIEFDYTIHRGGIDSFTIQLPGGFRVTTVSGDNIAKWSIQEDSSARSDVQIVMVKLYSPAKKKYSLHVKMERFLQEAKARLSLTPILTQQALRRTGLIGITHSQRRLVELSEVKNLARVDTGRLPRHLQNEAGVVAYRFISADYGGTIAIDTALPRIAVKQLWMLGVDSDRLELRGKLQYKIDRAGVFELKMSIPEPWKLESVGPEELVDDYQLKDQGPGRTLHILLKKELLGDFDLELTASAGRSQPNELVEFSLPLADKTNSQLYQGQLLLLLAEQLRAQVHEIRQLQAISVKKAAKWSSISGLSPAMAFEFKAIDRDKWAGGKFEVAVKPTRISALVHRLVNIQPGSIEQEAVVQYRIRYAPVDTFYLKMPASLADAGVQITGANIKEKPRIDNLPEDQQVAESREVAEGREVAEEGKVGVDKPEKDKIEWAYYKIVLQSKVKGNYRLKVHLRQAFQAGHLGKTSMVEVEPILAAGKLSDQSGHIVISKAETLAIAEPIVENLIPSDPGSSKDVPYKPHRKNASLAFKYDKPTFSLYLPVIAQKEATVFTTIINGVVIEQVLARDGMVNTHATFLLATSQGDRLPITLPADAQLTAVLLNGNESPVEMGMSPDERIVRLPPSAGLITRFVLEISCSVKDVSASNLTAPTVPVEIPVQQTLWRLWVPEDHYVLGHSRDFSRLSPGQCSDMLSVLQQKQPSRVVFKLPGQGKVLNFVRQGAPGELSVMVMGKEVFSIVVWLLILVAGAFMLKLNGFERVVLLLTAGLIAAVVHLFLPLLVGRVVTSGMFALVLVLLLWLGQWVFIRLPKTRKRSLVDTAPWEDQPARPPKPPAAQ